MAANKRRGVKKDVVPQRPQVPPQQHAMVFCSLTALSNIPIFAPIPHETALNHTGWFFKYSPPRAAASPPPHLVCGLFKTRWQVTQGEELMQRKFSASSKHAGDSKHVWAPGEAQLAAEGTKWDNDTCHRTLLVSHLHIPPLCSTPESLTPMAPWLKHT